MLHSICAYTICRSDLLEDCWRQGRIFSFPERKRWVRIYREYDLARKNTASIPIVFADARDTRTLIFRAHPGSLDS
jgi:hypothetical protein